jgi:hypothetical protein
MFVFIMLIGMAIGYALGYKNDRTLKQQIGKLKATVRRQNKSAQLHELTQTELHDRDNWDMRKKLAELTNLPPTTAYDKPVNSDPNSMENMF